MTTPVHILTGVAVGTVTVRYTDYDPTVIYAISTVASVLPDINMLWKKEISSHHRDFTHYPLFWILVSPLLLTLGNILTNSLVLPILILINVLNHLTMDLVGLTIGIHLFAPISMREYSITKLVDKRYSTLRQYWELAKGTTALSIEVGWALLMLVVIVAATASR